MRPDTEHCNAAMIVPRCAVASGLSLSDASAMDSALSRRYELRRDEKREPWEFGHVITMVATMKRIATCVEVVKMFTDVGRAALHNNKITSGAIRPYSKFHPCSHIFMSVIFPLIDLFHLHPGFVASISTPGPETRSSRCHHVYLVAASFMDDWAVQDLRISLKSRIESHVVHVGVDLEGWEVVDQDKEVDAPLREVRDDWHWLRAKQVSCFPHGSTMEWLSV